jgi:hypothetical protein
MNQQLITLIKINFLKISICIIQILFCQEALCQASDSIIKKKIYHVNYISGSIIIAGGLATDYPAIGRIKGKPDLTTAEINALNPDELNFLDKWGLHQPTSDYLAYSKLSDNIQIPIYTLLPAALALDKEIRKNYLDILMMYFEGHVITFTIYNYSWFGPTFQDKYRPITYYTNLPIADRTTGNNRNSAYSGHVASTAFTSFFVSKIYCDYHPDMGGVKYLLYTAALIPPLAMGYFRMHALAHFPSDDLTGLTIGAVVGIILPELHKYKCKNLAVSMLNIPGAAGLDVCWTLPISPKFNLN